jgi:hypothetical protein
VIVTQATLLAVIGLAFGIPLGIAFGRTLWRAAADMTPLAYHPPVALWALALIGPVALVARQPAGGLARPPRGAAAHRAHPAHRVGAAAPPAPAREVSTPGQVRPAPPARSP